jgi:hypothetical protein
MKTFNFKKGNTLKHIKLFFIFTILLTPQISTASKGPLPSRAPNPTVPKLLSTIPVKTTKIGTWVEYSVKDSKLHKKYKLKISFTGREGGGKYSWIEIAIKNAGRPIYVKILFEGTPGKIGKAKRMIIKFGGMQPMELPKGKAKKLLPIIYRKPMVSPKLVGKKDIRTPAGLFPKALNIKGVDADGNVISVWHHRQVHFWNLLKFNDGRFDMMLIGQGFGARSRIRGTPAPFSLPH